MAIPRLCSVRGCIKQVKARGLCGMHLYRLYQHGDPLAGGHFRGTPRTCDVGGCEKSAHRDDGGVRGFCRGHYDRWRRYGDPRAGRAVKGAKLAWVEANKAHLSEECLIWPFPFNQDGPIEVRVDGRDVRAARLMCERAHGPPPTAAHEAAHSCGKAHEGCMNPRHLRWATATENHQDAVRHGTHSGLRYYGSRHFMAKLTERDVLEIRSSAGVTNKALGEAYGVHPTHIASIRRRACWRHI